ncbi:MAG TPA: hypothetical protein VK133_01390 [Amoebophilaceae bacterium]|jgi:hypothetical protein|nr:hypothetical protein [Amoebophilaceae bacterium]
MEDIDHAVCRILKYFDFHPPFPEKCREMLELSLMLEEYFNISFDPNMLINLNTKAIVKLVFDRTRVSTNKQVSEFKTHIPHLKNLDK